MGTTFLHSFETAYLNMLKDGLTEVLERWRRYSVTLGQPVVIQAAGNRLPAVQWILLNRALLVVETEKGRETLWGGEVSLADY